MDSLRLFTDLPSNKLLKVKLKEKQQYLFGIIDSIGVVQSPTATPAAPTSPVNFRYSDSVESYLKGITEWKDIALHGEEIDSVEIVSI